MRSVSLVVVLMACHGSSTGSGSGTDSGAEDGPGGGAPTVATDGSCAVQALFTSQCTACHSPSGGLQGGLDLETDPVGALVDRPSSLYPGRTLVVPGDPVASFLVAKVAGTQGELGMPMPLPTGLVGAELQTVRSWVEAGAPAECDGGGGGTTGTPTEGVHASGWADPAEHGMAAKLQEDCASCHGADLTGGSSGVSCDGCHAPDWQTDCTFCHGGVDNATGAPPENIDDSTDAFALVDFPVHSAHVETTIHGAFACEECHAVPTDPFTPGHVFVGDTTPGEAEVAIPGATWSGGSCSNLYCHGDGQGANGTADASFVSTCSSCHPDWTSADSEIDGMSGQHSKHVSSAGFDCSECHGQTVDASHAIVDPMVHVDGTPTVGPLPLTFDAVSKTCDGTCHGESHSGRNW